MLLIYILYISNNNNFNYILENIYNKYEIYKYSIYNKYCNFVVSKYKPCMNNLELIEKSANEYYRKNEYKLTNEICVEDLIKLKLLLTIPKCYANETYSFHLYAHKKYGFVECNVHGSLIEIYEKYIPEKRRLIY